MAASCQHHLLTFLTLLTLAGLVPAGAAPRAETASASRTEEAMQLYLSVIVNGEDRHVVANFALHADHRMSSPRAELVQLGFRLAETEGDGIFLEDLPGLTYAYDEQTQTITFTAKDDALEPNRVSGHGGRTLLAPQPGYGSVLNYSVYATTPDTLLDEGLTLSGASLSVDHRIYTPYGVLNNSGAIRTEGLTYDGASAVRTDTYFNYVDQEKMVSYSAGDVISSSLPWARSVRLGGVQVKRDFGVRSDIITTPLLSASGSAAVPSSVDVYVGNVRTFSGHVDPGPFVLTDMPVIDRRGDARIVLRDVSGRETEMSVPFYAAQDLLKTGVLDYSVEAGFAREDFGEQSFSYNADPAAVASLRYGLTDTVTIEAHAEGKSDLLMAGAGLSTVLFDRAEVSITAGGSLHDGETGAFVYGRLATEIGGIDVNLSSFRSFGDFADLAYVTGVDGLGKDKVMQDYAYLAPARALDVASLGIPLYFDDSTLNLSLIHSLRADEEDLILSAGYSRDLGWHDASIHLNGFMDFGDDGGLGLVAGLSMPLGGGRSMRAGVARDTHGGILPSASIRKPLGSEIGSYGYNVDETGADIYGTSGAGGSYRTSFGVAEARLRANDGRVTASASFDGALVMAGGGVFASNSVHDGFAVVDAGVADVPVMLQNRVVGKTGRNGKALVPGLRSYASNKVSIDVATLPVDANVSATDEVVVPARRSGVSVNFRGGDSASALVILKDVLGKDVAPGAAVTLNGGSEESFVGYDGQLWLEGLNAQNSISVETADGHCTASFAYAPQPGSQVTIDPVECK